MEYIEINGKNQPFRFGLRALKKLNAACPEKFEKLFNGADTVNFADNIELAEHILQIGLNEGAKAAGEKYTVTKQKAEDLLDEGGIPFLEQVMAVFEKAISNPKQQPKLSKT